MTNVIDRETLPPRWVRRLKQQYLIWLVKEQQYARVAFPYHPAPPGFCAGELALRRQYGGDAEGACCTLGHIEIWYVDAKGKGFDGKQLILPCVGHLDDEDAEVMSMAEMSIRRHINRLEQRVTVLERMLWLADDE